MTHIEFSNKHQSRIRCLIKTQTFGRLIDGDYTLETAIRLSNEDSVKMSQLLWKTPKATSIHQNSYPILDLNEGEKYVTNIALIYSNKTKSPTGIESIAAISWIEKGFESLMSKENALIISKINWLDISIDVE